MSHCTENHNMDLTAWYKSQKLIILGKHYFVIPYIFWSKSEAIWDVMLSHHFLITLQYLFNIRLHIIIVSRGREPPFWLLDEDCLVERVGGQVFIFDHRWTLREPSRLQVFTFATSTLNYGVYWCSYVIYESFSDVGESRVWFASKNLTPCRMHWNAFLIAQMIAKCHTFPNMYGML